MSETRDNIDFKSGDIGKTRLARNTGPVKKRLKVLDALRGFALLGVCMANYKE